jgi:hypothetical protein
MKRERRDFERYVRRVESELKEAKKMDYNDEKDSTDKLFIHEFLFLLCNASGRIEQIGKLQKPEFTIQRKSIKRYEMQALEAMRLDTLFKIELKDIGQFAKDTGGHNPKEVLRKALDSEV